MEFLPLITAWICNGRDAINHRGKKRCQMERNLPGLITAGGGGDYRPVSESRYLPVLLRVAQNPFEGGHGGAGGAWWVQLGRCSQRCAMVGRAGGGFWEQTPPGKGRKHTARSGHNHGGPAFGGHGLCHQQHRWGPGQGWQQPDLGNN